VTTRAQVCAKARAFVGVPYRHQGRTPAGLDCIGLVVLVARELGLADYTPPPYRPTPDPAVLIGEVDRELERIPITRAREGDVLVMKWSTEPQHFALLVDGLRIVHSYMQARRVVEHRLDEQWYGRICRAYRFRGIEDV
jgi:cell wall-associated NlpC family hydrolase